MSVQDHFAAFFRVPGGLAKITRPQGAEQDEIPSFGCPAENWRFALFGEIGVRNHSCDGFAPCVYVVCLC